jgi:hypothetical protein
LPKSKIFSYFNHSNSGKQIGVQEANVRLFLPNVEIVQEEEEVGVKKENV